MQSLNNKLRLPLFLTLIAAGLAGNYFNFPLFLNIDFLFGSIFAMLALQFFGLGRGICAAAAIAAYTYFARNHPYAIVIMTAEVATVGWLMKRRKLGMVSADMLFWLVVGMPLVYLFYHHVMHVPPSNVYIVMTKQAMNGIANALLARLIFMAVVIRRRSQPIFLREIIANLLVFFVMLQALLMLATTSRKDFAATDRHIRTDLIQDSHRVAQSLESWMAGKKSAILNLAEMAATSSPRQMQSYLELVQKTDDNFLRVGLQNREATTTAIFPLTDNLGKSGIGINYADRPYISRLKRTLKPMLSEMVMRKIGTPVPMTSILAPVITHGEYNGYIIGVLSLEQIKAYLDKTIDIHAPLYSLLDKNGAIIMTNRTDQKVMTPFVRGTGTLNRLDDIISQWLPALPANTPLSGRWTKSLYIVETTIGASDDWKLILEQPVAPFHKALYDNYTDKLLQLFLILIGVLVLAEFLSRQTIITLDNLRLISHDLPNKIADDGKKITWPDSGMKEVQDLIENFREMAHSLSGQFIKSRQINESLEQQVNERTSKLSGLTHELGSSRARYFELYDLAPVGYLTLNEKWEVLEANLTAATLLGLERGTLLRQAFTRFILPEDQEICYLHRTQLLNSGTPQSCELRMLKMDGSRIWTKIEAVAAQDNASGKTVYRVVVSDITEHKKTEEEYYLFFNIVPDLACIATAEGYFKKINRAWEMTLGWSHEELLTTPILDLVHPEDRAAALTAIEKQRAGEEVFGLTNRNRCKDGSYRWLEWVSVPSDDGKLMFAAARDITERKLMEDEVRQALETARSANDTMTRLLRTLAHEFRTPLGLLTISSDILDRYRERLTKEEHIDQTEQIRSAANQLACMINSVISFNRPGMNHPEKIPSLLDIGRVCRAIAGEVETVWSTGHEFIVSIADDCGDVLLDEALFRRILENLLTNAFRYTPPDGSVSLRVGRQGNRLLLEVSDVGIGIPPEDQKLIFDAFYRCSNVEERRGLGLGLSIVHESLSQLGGIITVASRVGEGTTIRVEIPVVNASKPGPDTFQAN